MKKIKPIGTWCKKGKAENPLDESFRRVFEKIDEIISCLNKGDQNG